MSYRKWHQQHSSEALKVHESSVETGLSQAQVDQRVQKYGLNRFEEAHRKSPWRIFISQFSDLLVLILIGAAIIASWLGEPQDTVAIVAIVFLNAVMGFWQEYRAEKAMMALKALSSPSAKVKRSGQILTVPAFALVPGDIVYLEAGNIVPADLRILEEYQLSIDESALTGESQSVDKHSQAIDTDSLVVADQKNMAFKGTIVASGRALGLVVQTGMSTELGKIAKLLKEEIEVQTPLQNRMARFAKKISLVVLGICIFIFAIGLLQGQEPVLMFMTSLSLAVAAIPEALPAVVSVALALGARTMSRKNSLIRRLPAVEALGSVTYICSDKTGTLTENRMQARVFFVDGLQYTSLPKAGAMSVHKELLISAMALNNDVSFDAQGILQGDPTETALVQASLDLNFDKRTLEKRYPRVAELPFSSDRGMMTTLHQVDEERLVISKGAPEKLLLRCALDDAERRELEKQISHFASQGCRVLAFGYRYLDRSKLNTSIDELERDFIFLGLVGLIDPPRSEVKEAVRLCHEAGIEVVMITGDHPITAMAIARQLGISSQDSAMVLTGLQLSQISEEELKEKIRSIKVFARVAPEQKIRLVKTLQSLGEIVAMTGDGVNDAPALRGANVGVSMGKSGTDVAREASHIILLDDNFATIVSAVKEGRRIYDNIRKFVRFALSGNSGELCTLLLAPLLGLPTPLLPIHILWVNLVTDGLPGLMLALEPGEKNLMQRKPREPDESIFSHGLWQHTLWVGLLIAALTLGTMFWAYSTSHSHWQSMAFTVLTFTQMAHILAIRSERESFFRLGLRSNWPLMLTVGLTLALQLCTLYVPFLNDLLKTQPLSLSEVVLCLAISSVVFWAVEIEKWFRRREKSF